MFELVTKFAIKDVIQSMTWYNKYGEIKSWCWGISPFDKPQTELEELPDCTRSDTTLCKEMWRF